MREFAVLTDDLGVGNRKIIGLLMGLLVFVALLGVFTDKSDADAAAVPRTAVAQATAAASARCLSVPRGLVKAIATGLTVNGGGTLHHARAVRSRDFKRVYFISAEIDGPGMKGRGDIGTWVKSGPLRVGGGLIFAVDGFANEFSDWGDGRKTDAHVSTSDDGAGESKACVARAER
jgi:hypothetical protein